jgi:hypothetical protein
MRSGVITGPMQTRAMLIIAVMVLSSLFSGCTSALQKELRLTRQQLQEKVEQIFPIEQRQAFVHMVFSKPQILLADSGERIGLALHVEASMPGMGVMQGQMELDGGLEYRAKKDEIAITDTRLITLDIEGLSAGSSKSLQTLAAGVVKKYLAEVPIYRLDQDDFKQSLTRLMLKSVAVREGEVVATLGL